MGKRSSRRVGAVLLALAAGLAVSWAAHRVVEADGDRAGLPGVSTPSPPPSPTPSRVVALGRLEPREGVVRVAGPSRQSVVIAELRVDEGDFVEAGEVIAVLDSVSHHEADVARLQAELSKAELDYQRYEKLYRENATSTAQRDSLRLARDVARANLARARAELEFDRVRAPTAGQVLEVHARAGERVGPEGIVELGRTREMFAIAEVYETDIGRVEVGRRATVTSPALPRPLEGTVETIGLKVAKADVLETDPAAKADARVVEVEIRLDESAAVAGLTNLQVQVEINP